MESEADGSIRYVKAASRTKAGKIAVKLRPLLPILHRKILKEDWLEIEPWFVLWLFTVTGKIYRSSYGIEIDW